MYAVIFWKQNKIYPVLAHDNTLLTFDSIEKADHQAEIVEKIGYEARTISIEGVCE